MKQILSFFTSVAILASCAGPAVESSIPHKITKGRVVLEVPEREPGQESALLLTCAPLDTVRTGFIGVGMRGKDAVKGFTYGSLCNGTWQTCRCRGACSNEHS